MRQIISMFLVAFCGFFLTNCDPQINDQRPVASSENTESNITVEYPEVYELANIILALTDYGKTDPLAGPQRHKILSAYESVF